MAIEQARQLFETFVHAVIQTHHMALISQAIRYLNIHNSIVLLSFTLPSGESECCLRLARHRVSTCVCGEQALGRDLGADDEVTIHVSQSLKLQ